MNPILDQKFSEVITRLIFIFNLQLRWKHAAKFNFIATSEKFVSHALAAYFPSLVVFSDFWPDMDENSEWI